MTLTISEVAAFAQVTVRTVRHYHHIGLMPEPKRDSLDRRVYQPEDALRLARIRSLVDAGFTLPDIDDVMREHEVDAAALERVQVRVRQRLTAELETIKEQQRSLESLGSPDYIGIPPKIQEVIETIGTFIEHPEAFVEFRNLWLATCALYPTDVLNDYADYYQNVLFQHEGYCYWLRRYAELWDAPKDDPRIDEVVRGAIEVADSLASDTEKPEEDFPPVLSLLMDRLPPAILELNRRIEQEYNR